MTSPDSKDAEPTPDLQELRRTRLCPKCKGRLEEDAWGERHPITGLLYAEPRLYCTSCRWLQPR